MSMSETNGDPGFYGMRAKGVSDRLDASSREELRDALVEIYEKAFCDEGGYFNPEESLAADSAADFVESVGFVFQRLNLPSTNERKKTP